QGCLRVIHRPRTDAYAFRPGVAHDRWVVQEVLIRRKQRAALQVRRDVVDVSLQGRLAWRTGRAHEETDIALAIERIDRLQVAERERLPHRALGEPRRLDEIHHRLDLARVSVAFDLRVKPAAVALEQLDDGLQFGNPDPFEGRAVCFRVFQTGDRGV